MNPDKTSSENSPAEHPMVGQIVGQYKIVEPIGQGGMGMVFKGRHEIMNRDVAVKVLSPTIASDEIGVKRIKREATAMGNLQHPHIGTVYDFGVSQMGQPFIVMELIRGITLKDAIMDGRMPVERALPIFMEICEAMAFAHDNGVIHRDLKPPNIMLTSRVRDDFVKILDFGIAKSSNDSVAITKKGEVVGSPLYMSPEQITGKPADARSDIYALGSIMFETITGIPPYRGETIYETIMAKTTELPPLFIEISAELAEHTNLEKLIRSCLASEPSDRPSSMHALRQALSELLPQQTREMTTPPGASKASTASREVPVSVSDADASGEAQLEDTLREPEAQSTVPVPPEQTASEPAEERSSTTQSTAASLPEKRLPLKIAAICLSLVLVCSLLGWAVSSALHKSDDKPVPQQDRATAEAGSEQTDTQGASKSTRHTHILEHAATISAPAIRQKDKSVRNNFTKKRKARTRNRSRKASRKQTGSTPGKKYRESATMPPVAPPRSEKKGQNPYASFPSATSPNPYSSAPAVKAPKRTSSSRSVSPSKIKNLAREAKRSYKHHKKKIKKWIRHFK